MRAPWLTPAGVFACCIATAYAVSNWGAHAARGAEADETAAAPEAKAAGPTAREVEFFEKKFRPVLAEHCYKCHAADSPKVRGQLYLDTRSGTLKGGETGPAVIPGDPDESLLIQAMRHESFEMPPDKKLPDQVIADFEAWVKMGAPDPRSGGEQPIRREIDLVEGRKFWAFQQPLQAAVPAVNQTAWPRSNADRFVLAALEAQGLAAVAAADRRVLIRRAYLDRGRGPLCRIERQCRQRAVPARLAIPQLCHRLL